MSTYDQRGGNRTLPVKSFPTNKAEMLAERLNQKSNTLNDIVETILLDNVDEDEALRKFLEAWDNDNAVTGRCDYDDVMATHRIMDLAKGALPENIKLATVKLALGVALRRYGLTRKQRIEKARREAEAQASAAGVGE